jgi:hypothetical protein
MVTIGRTIQLNNNNRHVYAGQLNSFTHLRALMVLLHRGNSYPMELLELRYTTGYMNAALV